ncbi:hypothetical protein EIG75_26520 [Pseudomonas syringae]|uniref:Uncharacterized protein n=1 Tax=Pseudomonas syringae TaxID=317 RepID=A0A6B2B2E2_PSESX|nr:hypothetical protein [Pseudomonas syringae]NAO45671.1 hypothetical protein [Pseudomonas syringae]NAO50699.1 hypothetical protein [Pseudomonas syringae]NAO64256.1 hypothetical protein [Pseudomonas syringae]NAO69322.1 hypothetical protein [Pseudomonas syringae]
MCKLAHEEVGAAAEYLLSSQSAFASKLAPTGGGQCVLPVGVSLLTKAIAQTAHFPKPVPASSRTSSLVW